MNEFIKKHSGSILATLASLGVVGTAVVSAMGTAKAVKKLQEADDKEPTKMEVVKAVWPYYIPTALMASGTIACIVGGRIADRRANAALASALGLVSTSYQEYQSKLKELYGEEAHNNVMDAIIKEKAKDVHITSDDLCSVNTLDWGTADPEVTRTFYDSYSQRYFESTISRVLQAEYHFNRNYALGGAVCIDDFYNFLGIDTIAGGENVGYDVCQSEIYWVDFNHRVTHLDDGMEVLVIDYPWFPMPFEEEYE